MLLTWIVFGQTLRHDFVNFDDPSYVQQPPEINRGLTLSGIAWAFTHAHSHNWHPLTSISHMLDCELFGLNPRGHHFMNVLLHSATAVLLFAVLLQMTAALWRSAFVAAVFAIHPLRVESVAWISERKDVLSGLFFMLTLLAYGAYVRRRTTRRYLLVAALFVLGLTSKPMLVTVPLVLFLLDFWPLQREQSLRELAVEKLPLLGLALAASAATIFAQTNALISAGQLPLGTRVANALIAAVTYVRQMLWPVDLAVFYPFRYDRPVWQFALAAALLVGATAAAFLLRKQRPYVTIGWLWYVVMLGPVIGIIQVGSQAHADRYTYLPQIGLYVLCSWAVADLLARIRYAQQIAAVAATALIALLAWSAHAQTQTWRSTETLWHHALAVTTGNNLAHGNLADFYLTKNRVREAIPHLQKELAIRPQNPRAHNKLGLALVQTGDPSAGIAHWLRALQIDADDLNTQSNLAWVFATAPDATLRNGPEAVRMAENVLAQSERAPILLRTLAAAYAETGRFSDAIATTREAIELAKAHGAAGLASELQANIYDYQLELPLRDSSLANARRIELP